MRINEFDINKKKVVTPEFGINFNESLETAREMALSAKRGVTLIKNRAHIAEDETGSKENKEIREMNASQFAILWRNIRDYR